MLKPTTPKVQKQKMFKDITEQPKKQKIDPKTMLRPAILDRIVNTAMS